MAGCSSIEAAVMTLPSDFSWSDETIDKMARRLCPGPPNRIGACRASDDWCPCGDWPLRRLYGERVLKMALTDERQALRSVLKEREWQA